MQRLGLFILATGLGAALVGCGTKGPLYVPGIPVTAQWPYPTPAPQPAPATPKPADVPATSEEKK
jgi:predicted small lipoprotein YifL